MRYLIAYDVSSDASRQKVADLLLDLGDRVQKSVFEAELTRNELKVFLDRAVKYLQADDSLRVYPLCGACASGIECRGRSAEMTVNDLVIL